MTRVTGGGQELTFSPPTVCLGVRLSKQQWADCSPSALGGEQVLAAVSVDAQPLEELEARGGKHPHWCLILNQVMLTC